MIDARPRPAWGAPLVGLVAVWGVAEVVLAALLIGISAAGQPFALSTLSMGLLMGVFALATLAPVLSWLGSLGTRRLLPTVAPGFVTILLTAALIAHLLAQPSTGA